MKLSAAIDLYIAKRQAMGEKLYSPAAVLRALSRSHGEIELSSLTPDQMSSFLSGPRTGPATWRHKYGTLRVFFEHWRVREELRVAPLPPPAPKYTTSFVPYIYSVSELRLLLAAVPCCQRRDECLMSASTFRALLLLLYGTGMRIGEALRLRGGDADLVHGILTVRGTKFYKSRLVPLGANVHEHLRAYLASAGRVDRNDEPLFQSRLSDHFVVDSQNSAVELEEAAGVLDGTPWYKRFTKRYRQSKRAFETHCKVTMRRSRSQQAACLRLLAQSRRNVQDFASNTDYRAQLGAMFSGVDTAWDDLMAVVRWHESVFTRLPEHLPFAVEVRTALLTLPATRLKSILGVDGGTIPAPAELQQALELLTALHGQVPNLTFDHEDADISVFMDEVRSVVDLATGLLTAVEPLGLPRTTTHTRLMEISEALEKARLVRDQLDSDERA